MEVLVELTGVTPMVMHNIRLADKTDPIVIAIAELTSKGKNKTDADNMEIMHLEFVGGLYYEESVGVYVPSWNIIRTFEQGGKVTKKGTTIIRALSATTDKVPLIYSGPRTPEELWQKPEFQWRTSVGIQRAKITRMRPLFRTWQLSFALELDEEMLNPREFVDIAARAGRSEGLNDARKLGYGRFNAEVQYDDSSL